ncbi:MAG: DinB family protein [Acidobacteria bacterium]|nr:DinB family protein [Acidobacteriota bacterium]MBV9474775.1 DinB family protein [Acidobacteriota bacterium]
MTHFEALRSFPATLRAIYQSVPADRMRQRAGDGNFALVEQFWHLGDLEVEGFGARIDRILREDEPSLPDFNGLAIARERRYIERDPAQGLQRFEEARRANLERLASLDDASWLRAGHQEGAGRVTLRRVVEMMAAHDAEHAEEIRVLHEQLVRA